MSWLANLSILWQPLISYFKYFVNIWSALSYFLWGKINIFLYCTGGSKRGDKDKISCLELVSFQFSQNNLFLELAIFRVISFQITQNYLSLFCVCAIFHMVCDWSRSKNSHVKLIVPYLDLFFSLGQQILHHYHVHTS